jgi:hypothetical protein
LTNGKVEDFGTPCDLLENKTSILYDLVSKLGDKEFQRLMEIAKAHSSSKKNSIF